MSGAQTPEPSDIASAMAPETAARSGSLLGRISHHLRTQNWTAVVIEFLVVVFGIFLGFQLNNWNEERGEAERRAGIIGAIITNLDDSIGVQERMVDAIEKGLADWEQAYAAKEKPAPYYFRIEGSDTAPTVWSTFEQMQLTELLDPVTLFDLAFFYSELDGVGRKYIRYATFVENEVLPREVVGGEAFYAPDGSLLPQFRANMDRLRDFSRETVRQTDWARCLVYRLEAKTTFNDTCRRAGYLLEGMPAAGDQP